MENSQNFFRVHEIFRGYMKIIECEFEEVKWQMNADMVYKGIV